MNESRQTVETDTLWLSNIRALNFRKPGHLRKYCNNKNFPIYGIDFVGDIDALKLTHVQHKHVTVYFHGCRANGQK